jgi:hypothetical protein
MSIRSRIAAWQQERQTGRQQAREEATRDEMASVYAEYEAYLAAQRAEGPDPQFEAAQRAEAAAEEIDAYNRGGLQAVSPGWLRTPDGKQFLAELDAESERNATREADALAQIARAREQDQGRDREAGRDDDFDRPF